VSAIPSPISGRVIAVHVQAGDAVVVGDPLCTVESMKMEIPIEAEAAGVISELMVAVGAELAEGDVVARLRTG
jgi:acetyl-CoA carboxylase biotin carboxyl carrier protein